VGVRIGAGVTLGRGVGDGMGKPAPGVGAGIGVWLAPASLAAPEDEGPPSLHEVRSASITNRVAEVRVIAGASAGVGQRSSRLEIVECLYAYFARPKSRFDLI
jgi:hypothetical protein